MGTVNPLGNSIEELWDGISSGRCGIGPITRFDPSELPSRIAGEVKNFDPSLFMDKKESRKMALFSQYALAASVQAMEQAGFSSGVPDPARTGIILGNSIGGFEILEDAYRILFQKGPNRIPPMTIPKILSNEGPGNIAIRFGINGPAYAVNTACASGTDAVGQAVNSIRHGVCDVIIAGGSESSINKMAISGFCVLKALSTGYNDTPQKACRPFDAKRDGFIMAEGSGILVLEELEHARKRGAAILAEIAGYGSTSDAYHLTAPTPDGRGAAAAMSAAVRDAGLEPEDIDYINAHGTSTPTNDPIETKSILSVFGDHAYNMKVSSTKSMTGHLVGAAGALEAVISILAIKNQFFPPTINLENPAEECSLDYVPNRGEKGRIKNVLSNSLGFGGHNSVLAIREYNG